MDPPRLAGAAVVWLVLTSCHAVVPRTLNPSAARDAVRSLPSYTRLTYSGLAFSGGRLYAASNAGVFRFNGGESDGLLQWGGTDNVVEGPWPEAASGSVWFYRRADDTFVRMDQNGWTRIPAPGPAVRGTRNGWLEGYHLSAGRTDLWVAGSGRLWRRSPDRDDWIPEPDLPGERGAAFVAALEGGPVVVTPGEWRTGADVKAALGVGGIESDRVFALDGNEWRAVPSRAGPFSTRQLVSTPVTGYLRTSEGRLLQFDREGIETLDGPGECLALAVDADGNLWGCFSGRGIYVHRAQGGWELQFPQPAAWKPGTGRVHLAAEGRRVALATSASFRTTEYRGTWTGEATLWLSTENSLQRVSW